MHRCPDHLTKRPTGLARLGRAETNDWRAFARLCSMTIPRRPLRLGVASTELAL
jgi:hypothetical protein